MGQIGARGHFSVPGSVIETEIGAPTGSERFATLASELLGEPDTWTGRQRHILSEMAAVQADQARQNTFLAAIVEQSEDAILAKDADGIITEWNHGAETLYGYSPEEAIGAPIAMLIPPDRAGEDGLLLENILSGDAVRQYETTRLRRDGSLIEVSISISPLYDPDGIVTGASVIARDITVRVDQEHARLAAEEQLRITIEHAPIGVGLIDLTEAGRGTLLSANAAMSLLLGTRVEETRGQALLSAMNAEDVGALLDALILLAAGRVGRHELEVRISDHDGDLTWVLLAVAPVPTAHGLPPQSAVIHAMDIGDRKRTEGRLQQLADHDALTGLYNRRRFGIELSRAVAHSGRYGGQGALLLIDLDGFKYVNDTMGHSYGDELVTRVGSLLASCLRETDVVARIGGDEFAAIIHHADHAAAVQVAEKILQSLRDRGIVFSDQRHARVTGSIGLTTFTRTTGLTPEELLIESDLAMYQAKEAGKDQVSVYRRAHTALSRTEQRESWLRRLRRAIDTDGFTLLAQPVTGIRAAGLDHHELLLRLGGDQGELVAPSVFMHHAERFDLVQHMDRWVLERAIAMLEAQRRAGHDVALSVNVSAKTLAEPRFVDDLATRLAGTEVAPDRLIIEVTETAVITKIDTAQEVSQALRRLGCRFSIDDFGAGFTSFHYLKHLDVDFLKVATEVVALLSVDPADQLVIRSIVDVARSIGARTIAEGVSDEDSLSRLRQLGVGYGQGDHLGRPVPLVDALAVAAHPA